MSHIWVNPYLLELEFLKDGETVYVDTDGGGTVGLPVEGQGTGGVTFTYDGESIMTMEELPDVASILRALANQIDSHMAIEAVRQRLRRGQ